MSPFCLTLLIDVDRHVAMGARAKIKVVVFFFFFFFLGHVSSFFPISFDGSTRLSVTTRACTDQPNDVLQKNSLFVAFRSCSLPIQNAARVR